MALPRLDNRAARRLFLHKHGLAEPPAGPGKDDDLMGVIDTLGFVQIDSINTLARAHDLILFARRPAYRPEALHRLQAHDRRLFEHWTHDASILPMDFFPHWRLRFDRDAEELRVKWREWRRGDFEKVLDQVMDQVRRDGPCGSADVGSGERRGSGGWWDWNPSKTALEYLWHAGDLSVCHRRSFHKRYDLTERVIPAAVRTAVPAPDETIHWLCAAALDRLGFATPKELSAFWATVTLAEAKDWSSDALRRGEIMEIEVEGADGTPRIHFARPDVRAAAAAAPEPPRRLRVLSPFDPALRDRARAQRLFGFDYRIEVFVPAAKRIYGYYVFPVLEGDRLVGRIDAKAYRDKGALRVTAFWPEPGIRMGQGRTARLEAELTRLLRISGCDHVAFDNDWLRDPKPRVSTN